MTGEDIGNAHREMAVTLVDLLVNYGLLSTVMTQYPEYVQEGFVERMGSLTQQMQVEILEVQQFGEALDR